MASFLAEAVSRPHREQQRLGMAILTFADVAGQFFGRPLLAAGIEQNQSVSRTRSAIAQPEQCRLVLQRDTFHFHITRDPLQVYVGQGLNCRFPGFADPGDLPFHTGNLNTRAGTTGAGEE